MIFKRSLCVALLTATALLHSAPAAAEWWFTPFGGTAFGGQVPDGPRLSAGVSAARTGDAWWGFEIDLSRTGDFFRISDTTAPLFDESRTTTLMGNLLVTGPQAWWGDR
ncbi:MAG: hypothetical protein ABJC89_21510, partial [Acidobacteriota bacterium]